MKLNQFFNLAISDLEEEVACYLYLSGKTAAGIAPEIYKSSLELLNKLKKLPPDWARELALSVVGSG